jgi:hypothetical protein
MWKVMRWMGGDHGSILHLYLTSSISKTGPRPGSTRVQLLKWMTQQVVAGDVHESGDVAGHRG